MSSPSCAANQAEKNQRYKPSTAAAEPLVEKQKPHRISQLTNLNPQLNVHIQVNSMGDKRSRNSSRKGLFSARQRKNSTFQQQSDSKQGLVTDSATIIPISKEGYSAL